MKDIEIPIKGISDNIVFTKNQAFAFYKVSPVDLEFVGRSNKIAYVRDVTNTLKILLGDRIEEVDCFMMSINIPFDLDLWKKQIDEANKDFGSKSIYYEIFVRNQLAYLENAGYLKRVTFLAISLGYRNAISANDLNFLDRGLNHVAKTVKEWSSRLLSSLDEISESEENRFSSIEGRYYSLLANSSLDVSRCSGEEILYLHKYQFYPSMPVPPLDVYSKKRYGKGDVVSESVSKIERGTRWLKFTQIEGDESLEGYKAILSFKELPKEIVYPGVQFLNRAFMLSTPFNVFSHFKLIPSRKMRKNLEKAKKDHKDELNDTLKNSDNLDNALGNNISEDFKEAVRTVSEIESELDSNEQPWVEGTYHIIVEAPNQTALSEYCNFLITDFSSMGFKLVWTSFNQMELFKASLPGAEMPAKYFKQTTNLEIIGASGFSSSVNVGDPIRAGEYIA